jgi:hypothetical protein
MIQSARDSSTCDQNNDMLLTAYLSSIATATHARRLATVRCARHLRAGSAKGCKEGARAG